MLLELSFSLFFSFFIVLLQHQQPAVKGLHRFFQMSLGHHKSVSYPHSDHQASEGGVATLTTTRAAVTCYIIQWFMVSKMFKKNYYFSLNFLQNFNFISDKMS